MKKTKNLYSFSLLLIEDTQVSENMTCEGAGLWLFWGFCAECLPPVIPGKVDEITISVDLLLEFLPRFVLNHCAKSGPSESVGASYCFFSPKPGVFASSKSPKIQQLLQINGQQQMLL